MTPSAAKVASTTGLTAPPARASRTRLQLGSTARGMLEPVADMNSSTDQLRCHSVAGGACCGLPDWLPRSRAGPDDEANRGCGPAPLRPPTPGPDRPTAAGGVEDDVESRRSRDRIGAEGVCPSPALATPAVAMIRPAPYPAQLHGALRTHHRRMDSTDSPDRVDPWCGRGPGPGSRGGGGRFPGGKGEPRNQLRPRRSLRPERSRSQARGGHPLGEGAGPSRKPHTRVPTGGPLTSDPCATTFAASSWPAVKEAPAAQVAFPLGFQSRARPVHGPDTDPSSSPVRHRLGISHAPARQDLRGAEPAAALHARALGVRRATGKDRKQAAPVVRCAPPPRRLRRRSGRCRPRSSPEHRLRGHPYQPSSAWGRPTTW